MRRRYLVTGGAGFVGSHLVDALLARGDLVVVLDDLSTGRLRNLDHLGGHPGLRFVHGSVLDELTVDELVQACDRVVHLAAAVGVRLILDQPLQSFLTNVRGTEAVVEAACRHGRPVLLASSSEVYGRNERVPLAEDDERVLGSPSAARWGYGTAKSMNEFLAAACHRERGLAAVVVRLFNTVGPRQSPIHGMVLPRLVRQAVAGEPLTVYGDGRQRRCFCHVADVVDALLRLLDCPGAVGRVCNVGSTEEVTILDLARRIVERTGSASTIRLVAYDEAYATGFEDVRRRVPSIGRVGDLTGWRPTRTLDHILTDVAGEAAAEHAAGVAGRVS